MGNWQLGHALCLFPICPLSSLGPNRPLEFSSCTTVSKFFLVSGELAKVRGENDFEVTHFGAFSLQTRSKCSHSSASRLLWKLSVVEAHESRRQTDSSEVLIGVWISAVVVVCNDTFALAAAQRHRVNRCLRFSRATASQMVQNNPSADDWIQVPGQASDRLVSTGYSSLTFPHPSNPVPQTLLVTLNAPHRLAKFL